MYINGKNITFTDRSNNSVDMFLRDIKKSAPLSSAAEHELWQRMSQGDVSAKCELIYANLRYVVTIAKKYLPSGTAFEDLIMAGSLGITEAANAFDGSLGYRFISYASWYIESEVKKVAYDHIKYKSHTSSFDEPLDADDDDSPTMISCLRDSSERPPDWQIRYDDALNAMKSGLDKHYCQGTGAMLDDFLSMLEKGYTTSDFARKYRLTDPQMKRFLDMLRIESRHLLRPAA